jgi:hypothetical protein
MLVKELLDKQGEWTYIILVSEECDCEPYCHNNKTNGYVTDLEDRRNEIYNKYGDMEVKCFKHFIDDYNRITMEIQII